MLTLHRQFYGQATLSRSVRLTAKTVALLTYLAPRGLQAAAIALAVELLYVARSGDPGEADDFGEVLAAACGWDTERLERGLALVRSAVQRAGREHGEAIGEMECIS